MADAKTLKKFSVVEEGEGFRLHIEDETGSIVELAASRDQLDVIVDSLDEILSATEEEDEVEG